MNIYVKKQIWKGFLLLGALIIAFSSLFYTNSIVDKLANEECIKILLKKYKSGFFRSKKIKIVSVPD